MTKRRYRITGMSCSACSARVQQAASSIEGVSQANVNLLKNELSLELDEGYCESSLIQAIEKAGYGVQEYAATGSIGRPLDASETADLCRLRVRLLISLALCCLLMLIAMGHMVGMGEISTIFQPGWLNAVIQCAVAAWVMLLNHRFFVVGIKSLISRAPNMDALVALGSSASFLFSIYSLIKILCLHGNNVTAADLFAQGLYFDSAAMIPALISLGKYFEARAKSRTTDAIKGLMRLIPDMATVLVGNHEQTVPIKQIGVGDIVVVKTGARIPVDGIVVSGEGAADESALTGESLPVEKHISSEVSAGTVLTNGHVRLRATRIGSETALAQVIKLIDETTSSKAPVARLADRLSAVFVPLVIAVSVLTAVVWICLGHSVDFAFTAAVSVLVISCPCALGLATPTAIMVGSGRGAERGLLLKSAEAIEQCHRISCVVLDKTGTVTTGRPIVTDIITLNQNTVQEVLCLAASVETFSEHPLAIGISEFAKAQRVKLIAATQFRQRYGLVSAHVDARFVQVGAPQVIASLDDIEAVVEKLTHQGKTVLAVVVDNEVIGLIALSDRIKAESAQAVSAFKRMGMRVLMLTGDNSRTARAIGDMVGIADVQAGLLPQDKANIIAELQGQGEVVLMIGDGVNDAPSLIQADVGMAIGAGTDIAMDSADIVLVKSRLTDAVAAVELGRAVVTNIRENLFWAFFYNVICIPVAAGLLYPIFAVTLNPMIAAAAMSVSSVTVVCNALRLRRWMPPSAENVEQPTARSVESGQIARFAKIDVKTTHVRSQTTMKKEILIDGMHCQHCTGAVRKFLGKIDGVEVLDVSLEEKKAVVEVQDNVSDACLRQTVTDLDFTVVEIKNA